MVQGYSQKVVAVQINGAPEIVHSEKNKSSGQPQPVSKGSNATPVRIWIDIRISNGLHLSCRANPSKADYSTQQFTSLW